jgi:hypothetical protein
MIFSDEIVYESAECFMKLNGKLAVIKYAADCFTIVFGFCSIVCLSGLTATQAACLQARIQKRSNIKINN